MCVCLFVCFFVFEMFEVNQLQSFCCSKHPTGHIILPVFHHYILQYVSSHWAQNNLDPQNADIQAGCDHRNVQHSDRTRDIKSKDGAITWVTVVMVLSGLMNTMKQNSSFVPLATFSTSAF